MTSSKASRTRLSKWAYRAYREQFATVEPLHPLGGFYYERLTRLNGESEVWLLSRGINVKVDAGVLTNGHTR